MEPTAAEEDDELERYVRQRMADDSCKPSPSYHSPDYPNAHSLRYRRRSPSDDILFTLFIFMNFKNLNQIFPL